MRKNMLFEARWVVNDCPIRRLYIPSLMSGAILAAQHRLPISTDLRPTPLEHIARRNRYIMPTKTPAAILIKKGKPMVIDDIELPDLGPSHVLVKQFATGVCHSQLHELDRPQAQVPLVLGHESTGVVVATGSNVTHVKEGDHVMVTWVQRNPVSGPAPVPAQVMYKGEVVKYGAPGGCRYLHLG